MRVLATAGKEEGLALVICLLAMFLLMALGSALVVTASMETRIAGNYRSSIVTAYAASAALERAAADVSAASSVGAILDGTETSSFTDGLPSGGRRLRDGSTIDLSAIVNLANCGRSSSCTTAQMDAVTAERPWGGNNARWRLYAWGPLSGLVPSGPIHPDEYLVVLAGDDESENDGDPLRDGGEGNPGSGRLLLRAQAFGPWRAQQGTEATVEKTPSAVKLLSWRYLASLDHP